MRLHKVYCGYSLFPEDEWIVSSNSQTVMNFAKEIHVEKSQNDPVVIPHVKLYFRDSTVACIAVSLHAKWHQFDSIQGSALSFIHLSLSQHSPSALTLSVTK